MLVVLYHATAWLEGAGLHIAYWVEIDQILATLRMPLFFALSGLFAGKWLRASWSQLWNVKLRLFLWVFLVWEVIGFVVTYGCLMIQGRHFGMLHEFRGLLLVPFAPRFELWFIWALAIFFVVARAARRVPPLVQLGVTAVISAVALTVDFDSLSVRLNIGWIGVGKYLFFFLLGIYGRELILRFSQVRPAVLVATFLVWAAVAVPLALADWQHVPGAYFLNCLLGVAAGVAVSRALSRWARLRRIGANTLPIYLAHTPLILVITTGIVLADLTPALEHVAGIVPPIITIAAVALTLALHRACTGNMGRWLYEPPPELLRVNSAGGKS